MERCPTCQARLRQDPVCPRCKTDLSGLRLIESDAAIWLRRSVALLAAGDQAQALQAVDNSLRLKRDSFAFLLQGFLLRPVPSVLEEQPVQLTEEWVEEPPEQINALAPLAEEALQAEAPATDGVAQLDVTIRKAIAWTKKVWRKLYPLLQRPEKPLGDD